MLKELSTITGLVLVRLILQISSPSRESNLSHLLEMPYDFFLHAEVWKRLTKTRTDQERRLMGQLWIAIVSGYFANFKTANSPFYSFMWMRFLTEFRLVDKVSHGSPHRPQFRLNRIRLFCESYVVAISCQCCVVWSPRPWPIFS